MKKGFTAPTIPVVVAVLILVVGGIIYLNKSNISQVLPPIPSATIIPSPIPDETANWKIYTNKNFNFSFEYPNDVEIDESLINDFYTLSIRSGKSQLLIAPQGKYTDAPCVITKSMSNITKSSFTVKIGDKQTSGELVTFNGERTATCKLIISQGYDFLFDYPSPNSQARQIFAQILSTFKFTD